MQKSISNSTYGISTDFSFRSEDFIYVPLTWRLGVCRIEILKIRIASWKPKYDRSNSAIYYFDVKSRDEAKNILKQFEDFDFKSIEDFFDEKYPKKSMNTGQTCDWLNDKFIPETRIKYPININN